MARKLTGRPNGRPKKKIEMTPEMVITAMAMCQCTKVEVCAKLGICKDTFDDREGFSSLYTDGKLLGKSRLRQKLINTALEGNPQLLVFCGKSILGLKETSSLELSGPNGGPIQTEDLSLLTDDDLVQLEAIHSKLNPQPAVDPPGESPTAPDRIH